MVHPVVKRFGIADVAFGGGGLQPIGVSEGSHREKGIHEL
jgi:hypothetical protein